MDEDTVYNAKQTLMAAYDALLEGRGVRHVTLAEEVAYVADLLGDMATTIENERIHQAGINKREDRMRGKISALESELRLYMAQTQRDSEELSKVKAELEEAKNRLGHGVW